jgi:hypothetical protein
MDHMRANIHCTMVNKRGGRWVETVPTILAEPNKGVQPTAYTLRSSEAKSLEVGTMGKGLHSRH